MFEKLTFLSGELRRPISHRRRITLGARRNLCKRGALRVTFKNVCFCPGRCVGRFAPARYYSLSICEFLQEGCSTSFYSLGICECLQGGCSASYSLSICECLQEGCSTSYVSGTTSMFQMFQARHPDFKSFKQDIHVSNGSSTTRAGGKPSTWFPPGKLVEHL